MQLGYARETYEDVRVNVQVDRDPCNTLRQDLFLTRTP